MFRKLVSSFIARIEQTHTGSNSQKLMRTTSMLFVSGIVCALIFMATIVIEKLSHALLKGEDSLLRLFAMAATVSFFGTFSFFVMLVKYRKMVREAEFVSVYKELLKNEERLKLALENAKHGLWDYNVRTGEVYHSTQYYRILGYEPGDLPDVTANFENLLHPDDKARVLWYVREHTAENKGGYQVEFRMRAKDGSWRWILGRGDVAEVDEHGKPTRLIGTHTDISDIKETEKRLIELERKNSILAVAVTANHEMNQPLSVLKVSFEMLVASMKDKPLDESQVRLVDRILKALDRITEILRKFRDIDSARLARYNRDTMMVIFGDNPGKEELQVKKTKAS